MADHDTHDHTGIPGVGGGDFVFIGEAVAAGGESDLSVTGIPTTYRDLVIVTQQRSSDNTNGSECRLRVGAGSVDTGANYDYVVWFNGWTSGFGTQTAQTSTFGGFNADNDATAGEFGVSRVEIINYASTSLMRHWTASGYTADASGQLIFSTGGVWRNTSGAIDRVLIFPSAGNWSAGSFLQVYGRG